MKKIVVSVILCFFVTLSYAQEARQLKNKVILLISEQNIEGPQRAWWASEIDLSTTEAKIAQRLIEAGYAVIEPSSLSKVIRQERAFRTINLSEVQSAKIGGLAKADYVILGKAVASSGGNVPHSNMRSCFANLSVKVIRVSEGMIMAYLDSSGNSAHLDVITGGKEALSSAAEELATKIIDTLKEKGGSK